MDTLLLISQNYIDILQNCQQYFKYIRRQALNSVSWKWQWGRVSIKNSGTVHRQADH